MPYLFHHLLCVTQVLETTIIEKIENKKQYWDFIEKIIKHEYYDRRIIEFNNKSTTNNKNFIILIDFLYFNCEDNYCFCVPSVYSVDLFFVALAEKSKLNYIVNKWLKLDTTEVLNSY